MEFPIIVVSIVVMFIAVASVGVLIGRYIERFEWNKLIWEGKIPKPEKKKSFGNPFVTFKYYNS